MQSFNEVTPIDTLDYKTLMALQDNGRIKTAEALTRAGIDVVCATHIHDVNHL